MYIPYMFITSRLMHKFKDIETYNKHYIPILTELKSITEADDIQALFDCTTRNAGWQKKIINRIDNIINTTYDKNNTQC